jgi:hypothetical protein
MMASDTNKNKLISRLDKAREKVARIQISTPDWFSDWFDKQEAVGLRLKEKYGEDFDQPTMFLGVSMAVAEAKAAQEWIDSLTSEIIKLSPNSVENGHVYYGATGGGISIIVTPTSLGPIYEIQEAITGKKINLCEATDWYFYG